MLGLHLSVAPYPAQLNSCLAGKYQQLHLVINTSLLIMTLVNISPICQTNKNHTMMKNLEIYHHSWLIKLYVYTTLIRNFGLLERFCQKKMNDLTKSSPRVVEFFSETEFIFVQWYYQNTPHNDLYTKMATDQLITMSHQMFLMYHHRNKLCHTLQMSQ